MRRLGIALIIMSWAGVAAGVVDAQAPSPAQRPAGVRVYVPEAHVGLTLPVGWSVSVEYRRADPPLRESMPAETRWAVLIASEGQDAAGGCRLFRDEGSGLSLAEFAAGLLDPRTDVTITPASFDAGEAIRLDLALGEGHVAQQYVVQSDDAFYQLACVSRGAPLSDSWLSIAESIEFQS